MKFKSNGDGEEVYIINEGLTFDPSDRSLHLLANGKHIQLTNIVSKMLHYLCQNSRKVISHDEIMQFIWEERCRQISYGSLYQALLTLRKSFNEVNLDSTSIKSIRKKGIIFNANVTPTPKMLELNQSPRLFSIFQKFKAFNKDFFLRSVIIFIVVITICFGFLYFEHDQEIEIFKDYITAKNTPGLCKVKFNSDAANSKKHNRFLQEHPYLCVSNTVMYVTAYENISNISVVQCQDDYLDTKKMGNCRVYIF